jgi:undecaprenyl-diphosphatase
MALASVVQDVVDWIEPAFAVAGYYIIAAAVLGERSIFIGLLVPGDLILALGGVFASQGKLNLALVIVIGIIAAVAGESAGFWLGRHFGRGLIRRLPLVRRLDDRLEDAEDFFKRHGGKTVAIGRYATVAGAFVPFTAGVARMRYPRFLTFDVPAIAVWATVIALIGFGFGENLDLVDKIVSRFGYIMLGVVVGFFVGRLIWKKWRDRRKP